MGRWFKFVGNSKTDQLLTFQIQEFAYNSTRSENITMAWNFRTVFTWFDDAITGGDEIRSKVSLPMYAMYTNIGIADIGYQRIELSLNDNMTPEVMNQFKSDFQKVNGDNIVEFRIFDTRFVGGGNQDMIAHLLNLTFNTIIIMTMLLCFFALSANMSANLY